MVAYYKAVEALMTDRCDIEAVRTTVGANHATAKTFAPLATNVPCRLWFSYLSRNKSDRAASKTVQTVRMFLPPDTEIPCGSRVTVTRQGKQCRLKNTGTPKIFPSHMTIMAELNGGWS